jgi:hypothetical protein
LADRFAAMGGPTLRFGGGLTEEEEVACSSGQGHDGP